MENYLLDTNVLAIAEQYYSFDLCPSFWQLLEDLNRDQRLYSIQKVRQELAKGANKGPESAHQARNLLLNWLQDRQSEFFMLEDSSVTDQLLQVSRWAESVDRHSTTAKQNFYRAADLYLLAHGVAHQMTIVTEERGLRSTYTDNPSKKIEYIKYHTFATYSALSASICRTFCVKKIAYWKSGKRQLN